MKNIVINYVDNFTTLNCFTSISTFCISESDAQDRVNEQLFSLIKKHKNNYSNYSFVKSGNFTEFRIGDMFSSWYISDKIESPLKYKEGGGNNGQTTKVC